MGGGSHDCDGLPRQDDCTLVILACCTAVGCIALRAQPALSAAYAEVNITGCTCTAAPYVDATPPASPVVVSSATSVLTLTCGQEASTFGQLSSRGGK